MKVLVTVKRVVDYNVNIRLRADGGGVDLDNVKMAMNPFDEISVEEALRLREKGLVSEVIAVSAGSVKCEDTLRAALAMGADRAVHIESDDGLEPLAVAKLVVVLARREGVELILVGKQAIDDDFNQTGQMIAALLDWPQGTFASGVNIEGREITVVREIDGGSQTVTLSLPAVVTTDLRLNEPRYASLPNVMKAKRKPIERISALEMGVDTARRLNVLRTDAPPQRQRGVIVGSVAELVASIKDIVAGA